VLDRLLVDGQDELTVLSTDGEPLAALPLMKHRAARSTCWQVWLTHRDGFAGPPAQAGA
jgi:hypothetical protein